VVVADKRSPRDGKFIETIGTYDPKKPGHNSTLNIDRVEYWISKGAQPSDTVRSLIKKNKKATAITGPPSGPEQENQQTAQEQRSAPPPPVQAAS